jgi:hypothetical protein
MDWPPLAAEGICSRLLPSTFSQTQLNRRIAMRNKIDLKYRPHSYFWAHDIGVQLSSDIKGAERKALFETLVAQGRGDEVDELLAKPVLNAQERQSWGRFHPSFLGGEYLPDRKSEEVEIARITIASTTQDVTSVYARQGAMRILYRVVDEYSGDTLTGKGTRTSIKPMTLGQLTDFFLSSWNLMDVLHYNFEGDGYSPEEIKAFVVDASSSFYAEFGYAIETRIDKWLSLKRWK